MSPTINLLPIEDAETENPWGLVAAFTLLALGAGTLTFLFGRGVKELVTAPRYRPTLPVASEVSPALRELRTASIARLQAPVQAPAPPPRLEEADTHERGNWLRIPSLSISVPLAAAQSMRDEDILRTLQVGVVRYPNGVEPGQSGVVVVAGHSTGEPWKGRYRFSFLNARRLQPGDIILVDHKGIRYTYRVTGQRIVNPRSTPYVESSGPLPRLALLSCWPLWTTSQRLLVDAELASTARLVFRSASPPRS